MSIKYPLVPKAPGVPPLLRKNSSTVAAAVLLTKDAVGALLGAPAKWGVFKDGVQVIMPDSFISLDDKAEWQVPQYPLEEGGFQSYNKVTLPFEDHVVMTKGGSEADRRTFLALIDQISASTDLYDIVTPEKTYSNVNITRRDMYRDAQRGVSLLTVTLFFQEIRSSASAQFTQTNIAAAPSGSPQNSIGVLQSQPIPKPVPPVPVIEDIDNLPGFTRPELNYSELGFQ